MLLTYIEKLIYNSHLIASRTAKGRPFTIRKNFDDVDDKTYALLKKLSAFFDANKTVKIDEFFVAPYKYYSKDEYFNLDFFITPKAAKCYTLYKRAKERQDPDNEEVVEECKKCCTFIYHYCKENNITLEQYKNTFNGTTPVVLQHLRDHNINFYTFHGLECDKTVRHIESELLEFFIPEFNSLSNDTRIKFQKSTRLKLVIRKAFSIVEGQLLKIQKQSI